MFVIQCSPNGALCDEILFYLLLLTCSSFQVVKEAIASGVGGYDELIRKKVRKTAHGLRLTRDVAMSIASKTVSKTLLAILKIFTPKFHKFHLLEISCAGYATGTQTFPNIC